VNKILVLVISNVFSSRRKGENRIIKREYYSSNFLRITSLFAEY